MTFLVLYVDDILLASNSSEKLQEIETALCDSFEMIDLDESKMYLGMEINRDRKNKIMTLKQSEYTEKVLEKFNMKKCKPTIIPMVTGQVKNRENRKPEKIQELQRPYKAP